ncbi:MAG TPA: nuclear transport factor 2 family protein [bacterium]|jgi:ketosteroid isomerase-like protein
MKDERAQEVWEFVQALNRAWTVERDASKLSEFFHERMVALTPMDHLRREGRAACIEGWQMFVDVAKIHGWKETDPKVDLFADGNCAMVTYYYEMDAELGGQRMILPGRDMLTLIKEDGRWWAVADQFSPYPGKRG